MKYTRKTLNEKANTLASAFEMEGKPNLEIFNMNISKKYTKFTQFVDEGEHTEEEITAAVAPVKEAVNLYNDELRVQRLESLGKMSPKEAMISYLEDQCVPGKKCENDKESGWSVVADDKVEVDPNDFVSTICKIERDNILDMVCIFADNIHRMRTRNDEAYITRNSLTPGYVEMRKRLDSKREEPVWNISSAKLSYSKLAEQLDDLAQTLTFKVLGEKMTSKGNPTKMLNCDVKYIENGAIVSKSSANQAGTIQIRDEKTILRFVFRAIYTRYNELPYATQNSTRAVSKAPLSKEPNREMGESSKTDEFTPSKPSKAGEVTLGKPAK